MFSYLIDPARLSPETLNAMRVGMGFLTAILFTLLCIKVGRALNWMDLPRERKIHVKATVRIGGVAIFASHLLSLWYAQGFAWEAFPLVDNTLMQAASLCFLLGLWDDVFEVSAKPKLLIQSLIAVWAIHRGLVFEEMYLDDHLRFTLTPLWAPVLSFFWLIGVMNAFNLVDGLDGLAAGLAWICFTTFVLLGAITQNEPLFLANLPLIGVLLGFLIFNFAPARIFMGDSGSLYLGFLLAGHSLNFVTDSPVRIPLFVPMLILAFPILDTSTAILRRAIRYFDLSAQGYSWQKRIKKVLIGIVVADGNHIHHRMFTRYQSHRRVTLMLYAINLIPCAIAVFTVYLPAALGWFLFLAYVYFVSQFVASLDYQEFLPKRIRRQQREKLLEDSLKGPLPL